MTQIFHVLVLKEGYSAGCVSYQRFNHPLQITSNTYKCRLTSFLRAPRVPPASNTRNWSRRSDRDKRNCSRISRRRNVKYWIKRLGISLSWSENRSLKAENGSSWIEEKAYGIWCRTLKTQGIGMWMPRNGQRAADAITTQFSIQATKCNASSVTAARPCWLINLRLFKLSYLYRCRASSTLNVSTEKEVKKLP